MNDLDLYLYHTKQQRQQRQQVPSSFPIGLNTTAIGVYVPQLAKAFPARPVVLRLTAVTPQPATASFVPAGLNVTYSTHVGIAVILANGTQTEAFTLRADITASGTVGVNSTAIINNGTKSHTPRLVGKLSLLDVPLTLENTRIGNITQQVKGLSMLAKLLSATYIVPALNAYAQRGFPLPVVDGVALVNPSVQTFDGYVAVATDFKYTPSGLAKLRQEARAATAALVVVHG